MCELQLPDWCAGLWCCNHGNFCTEQNALFAHSPFLWRLIAWWLNFLGSQSTQQFSKTSCLWNSKIVPCEAYENEKLQNYSSFRTGWIKSTATTDASQIIEKKNDRAGQKGSVTWKFQCQSISRSTNEYSVFDPRHNRHNGQNSSCCHGTWMKERETRIKRE